MKIVALVSGGKDSCYSMMECVRYGHEITCIAHLRPPSHLAQEDSEIDSFMFQSVGYNVVEWIAECMQVPLVTEQITGKAITTAIDYESIVDGDEVEDLYRLLHKVQQEFPQVQGVSSGAIFSTYQRNRVENVCGRLGLTSLGYLWRRNQEELLSEMIQSRVHAILVKVASIGLTPAKHLGKSLGALQTNFMMLKDKYGMNVCGEGGEYETTTLDCPLFKKRIVIEESRVVMHSDDYCAPVAFLVIDKSHLESKTPQEVEEDAQALALFTADPEDLFRSRTFSVDPVASVHANAVAMKPRKIIPSTPPTMAQERVAVFRDQVHLSGISVSHRPKDLSVTEEVRQVLVRTELTLSQHGITMEDVCFVHLFVADMALFQEINAEYCRHFGHLPASRSCVQVLLQTTCSDDETSPSPRLLLDCFAIRNSGETKKNPTSITRQVLHVQSISSWAPTCIGPYSQANVLHGALILLAGQIALFPPTMQLVGKSHLDQAHQCLINIGHVLESLQSNLRHVAMGVVYFVDQDEETLNGPQLMAFCRDLLVSNGDLVDAFEPEDRESICSSDDEDENREKLEQKHQQRVRLAQHVPLLFVEVTGLPRNAMVEMEFQALTYGVLKTLPVQSDATYQEATHKQLWQCDFQQTYCERTMCQMLATATLQAGCADSWHLGSLCNDLVDGINQSLEKALCAWQQVMHLRVFYRQDVLQQVDVACAMEKRLGWYYDKATTTKAHRAAMTFIPVQSLQMNPLAVLSIQVLAQDLDKLETELWLRKQI